MKRLFITLILLTTLQAAFAQKISPEQYIKLYKDIAIEEMKRMGIPAAITLAQGLLETESGNSELVKNSNNHFGIKCKATWTGETYNHDDDAPGECFRVYKVAEDSYRDHSNFLRAGKHYAFLFTLDPLDYKGWARGLRKAGYATNPKYPDILIKHIEQYNLQQYSLAAVNNVPKFETDKYISDPVIIDTEEDTETPEETFTVPASINGSKCTAGKKGTSLLAIATANDISLSKLLEYNDMNEDGILTKDQVIFLEKKAKKGNKDFYIVQKGENLLDVAQKNGIQLQTLVAYNPDVIPAGTKLYLKPSGEAPGTNANEKLHEVQPKEGLYSIAKKYNISPQQIREWNNLEGDDLKIGQLLIIAK
ncbi:MAG: LysM peptidoglycan-binding domain-containing protein [Sphingobacteriales bacterium]|nr:LysM peptidoglycan-binding domain-containing protein [Sphingobacteriales bacterium]